MSTPAEKFSQLAQLPMGKQMFSRAVTLVAPYFATVSPQFIRLEPGKCEISMKNRRRVRNHIGTVHAIAMCNLCELAAGTMVDSTLPQALRWIPRGMTTRYIKKAETDLIARAEMAKVPESFVGDLVILVKVFDAHNDVVMEADITMYVSRKKAQTAVQNVQEART